MRQENQAIETDSEMTQMVELVNKDIKIAIKKYISMYIVCISPSVYKPFYHLENEYKVKKRR